MAEHKGLSVSIALGTVLIPLTAFAASAMVGDGVAGDEEVAVAAAVSETSVASAMGNADLAAACGPAVPSWSMPRPMVPSPISRWRQRLQGPS